MGDIRTTSFRRPRLGAAAVGALLTVSLVGCVGPDPLFGGVAAPPRSEPSTCGAPSFSCALPFPSDRWQIPDASTATGVRLEVPPNTISRDVLDQLGPRDETQEALIGADGFSPLTPIVFQLPDALGVGSVPADGGELVRVVDATTGERVPVRAEVSSYLADERGSHNLVLVWPAVKFAYGHQIFAALRRGVTALDGTPAHASPSLEQASPATRAVAARVEPSIPWDDYLTATSFVVRTEQSIVADVDRLAGLVRADDHPIRNVEVRPSLIGGAAALSGQVRITDFRDAAGVISRDGTAVGHELWVDFMAVLPERSAATGGAPVIMYGHGITVMKESMLVVAGQNAAKGYATIGIDVPNHGSRINEGGHIIDLAYPSLLGRVESLLLQGELDQLSLLLAIKAHLGSLDVLPRNWLAGTGGDGVADLDVGHVLYEGTSLGGVLGATFLALAPEVEGAFLQVPGSGIIDTLFHSLVWEMFRGIVPTGAPYGETHVLTFFAQNLLDRADNTYYLDRIRQRGTPIFLSYAVDDGIVPNASTERMISLLDLPLVGRQAGPIPSWLASIRSPTMPTDGRGYGQVPTGELYGNILKPFLTHLEFMNPISVSALDAWLDGRTAALLRR